MESLGTYDAVHVRLGDFGSLCAKRPKFCPPSDAELSRVFAVLDALNSPAPVLLLSDDPDQGGEALGNSRECGPSLKSERVPGRGVGANPRAAAEMDLAVGARAYSSASRASTVSQS